jgi:hypothetical protein
MCTLFIAMMNAWMEAARFGADTHNVMALRLMKLARGGPHAGPEAIRMVSEKVAAFHESHGAMMGALVSGSSLDAAAAKAYGPYRRAVRANRRRLTR